MLNKYEITELEDEIRTTISSDRLKGILLSLFYEVVDLQEELKKHSTKGR